MTEETADAGRGGCRYIFIALSAPSLSLSLSLPCTHGCSSGPWLQLWKRYDTNGRGALGTLSNTSSSRSGPGNKNARCISDCPVATANPTPPNQCWTGLRRAQFTKTGVFISGRNSTQQTALATLNLGRGGARVIRSSPAGVFISDTGSNIELVEGGGGGSLDMGGACGSFGHRPRASLCPTPVTISNLWRGWEGVIERGEGEGARGLFDHRPRASLIPTPVATSNLGREVGEGYSITKRGIHDSSGTRNRNGDRNTNSSNHETGGGRSCHKTHLLPQRVHHHPAIPAIR